MKSFTILLLATIAPLTAAEIRPERIPASAKWVLHADLDAMRATITGIAVLGRIEAEHGAKLRAAKRMFSVHLIDDLRGVTLFGDGRKDHAVVLFDGTLDCGHLTDLVRAAEDHRETDHAGIAIHTWKDKGKTQHAAFANDGLLVFSHQEDLLKEALDHLKSPAPGDAITILPDAGSRPLIAAGAKLAEIEMPDDAANVLRQVRQIRLAAAESDGRFSIRMDAEASDVARANRIRRLIDGMAALAEIGNAELSAGGFEASVTTTDKPGVSAVVSMPLGSWLGLLKKEAAKKKAAAGKP